MSFWGEMKAWVAKGHRNDVLSSDIVAGTAGGDIFGLGRNGNLPVVTERSALTLSPVWACTSLIAGAISTLPVNVYKREADQRTRIVDDPAELMLNEEWCPRWVASAAWEWLALSKLFHGDGFAEIKRKGNQVTGLVPLHPQRVEVRPWIDGSRLAYVVHPDPELPNGVVRILDQDDVLHVASLGFNGCRSLSPLQHALRMTGSVALATQDYSGQFFGNQARPDYAVVTPPEVKWTKEQVESFRSQLDEQHSRRLGNSHRPMVLTGGAKIESISLPNEDAELLATREFQIEEIARVYGVPPFMIGHNKNSSDWGSGIAERGVGFVRYVLRPHLNAICTEMNRKLFPRRDKMLAFDTFDLERADLKTLFETFRAAIGRAGEDGIMTVEEVRQLLNMPVVPLVGDLRKGEINETQSAD